MNTRGTRIREARKRAGYVTQEALGQAVGAQQTTISGWETGATTPDADDIAALCQVLDVSADWLLGTDREDAAERQLRELREALVDLTGGSLTIQYLWPTASDASLAAAA